MIKYPPDHQVGMRVPKGGSDCAKCKFVNNDQMECGNKYFQAWNGGPDLPAPADEYCCDFFESAEGNAKSPKIKDTLKFKDDHQTKKD